jgi:acyl-CoA thioester hydrolase
MRSEKMIKDGIFSWEDEVRDNEVDLQGIVNNANYFIYMAHARHQHLKELGIDFAQVHDEGYNLVLIATEMQFKSSLKSGDSFIVTSKIVPFGKIRAQIIQDVIRKTDSKVVTSAVNTITCLNVASGRPMFPEKIKQILGL